ncbi:unnamed protein product, partial [Prorocentrum cordatum]
AGALEPPPLTGDLRRRAQREWLIGELEAGACDAQGRGFALFRAECSAALLADRAVRGLEPGPQERRVLLQRASCVAELEWRAMPRLQRSAYAVAAAGAGAASEATEPTEPTMDRLEARAPAARGAASCGPPAHRLRSRLRAAAGRACDRARPRATPAAPRSAPVAAPAAAPSAPRPASSAASAAVRAASGSCVPYRAAPEAGQLAGDQVFAHPFVQDLLRTARGRVAAALGAVEEPRWLICVRTYGRAGNPEGWTPRTGRAARGLLQLTLAALEWSLGPGAAHSRCLIFVSHEDKDWKSGRYVAALRGTPWAGRVVEGVRGADLQVRFIEESFPVGEHLIIADDNIISFVGAHAPTSREGGNRVLRADPGGGGELARLIVPWAGRALGDENAK